MDIHSQYSFVFVVHFCYLFIIFDELIIKMIKNKPITCSFFLSVFDIIYIICFCYLFKSVQIMLNEGKQITSLYYSLQSCRDADTVTVLIVVAGTTKDIGIYCGRQLPPALMSSSNRLEVAFTSSGVKYTDSASLLPYTASSFTANFSFVTSEFIVRLY